jgi:Uma2 family endonuclease
MATVLSPPEQKVVLQGVKWETYEHLLADLENSSAPRLNYDRGTLEIMSPLPEHERYNRTIALLIELLAEEMGIDIENLGSATFRREDLEKGFEADSCFYIKNAESVSGKMRIDLSVDPPPDLIVEVDITSGSLDKFPIYVKIGVPEVWRYDGEKLTIFQLREDDYISVDESTALQRVSLAILARLVEESKTKKRTVWIRSVREWARSS